MREFHPLVATALHTRECDLAAARRGEISRYRRAQLVKTGVDRGDRATAIVVDEREPLPAVWRGQQDAFGWHSSPPRVFTGATSSGGTVPCLPESSIYNRSGPACRCSLRSAADFGGSRSEVRMPSTRLLAERLRSVIARRNLNYAAVAKRLGVDPKTVGNWARENDDPEQTEPTASNLLALCDMLEVSADFLLGRVDAEHGLPIGMAIIDDDALEASLTDPKHDYRIGIPIPRRGRIVTMAEAEKIQRTADAERRRRSR